uniref:Uncharacterized protein n=1 Tax=Fagus sylvatica TaxID=28930 RepID=A0A2N9HFN7_FAGSY
MVEANLGHGPIWFNANPDLTISLDDGAPEKALTLRINTSGYHMIEGSRPLALVYRIYYKLFKTNLNPQALIKDPQDQTLLLQASREDININVPKMIKWEDIKLPDEWDLPKEMPPTIQTPINIAEQDNLESVVQYHDDSLTQPFPPPQIFFCPASLTPPPTNLPYTVPHAASHQPPSRSSSLIHAAAAPRSVTPQLLSVTPQILAQSRRRSSLSHATDQQILAQSRRSSAL